MSEHSSVRFDTNQPTLERFMWSHSFNTTIIIPNRHKHRYLRERKSSSGRRAKSRVPPSRASLADNSFGDVDDTLFWMKNTSGGDGGAPASSRKSHTSSNGSSKKKGGDKATKDNIPVVYSHDGRLMAPTHLGAVVKDAVKRWYMEAERDAMRGDVKAMALLGQMLMEGYGCDVDVERGRQFAERARRRGYRMERVYCEI